jgi:hypothetical protein
MVIGTRDDLRALSATRDHTTPEVFVHSHIHCKNRRKRPLFPA